MRPSLLRRLDALAVLLLLLWAGMALGFGALTAPALFRLSPRPELAATLAGALVERLDWMAFLAFGGALALVYGGRWLAEVADPLPLGPIKVWAMTAFMALVFTALSALLITPRIRVLRAAHANSISSLAEDDADRRALRRNHALSTQVFLLRLLLAVGLAWGVTRLKDPRVEG